MSYSRTQPVNARENARPSPVVGRVTRSQTARRAAEFWERRAAAQASAKVAQPVVAQPVARPVVQPVVPRPVVQPVVQPVAQPVVGRVTRSQTARRALEFLERRAAAQASAQAVAQATAQATAQQATESIPRNEPTPCILVNYRDEELLNLVRPYENYRSDFTANMRNTDIVYKLYELPRDVRLRSTPLLNREIIGHFTNTKTRNMCSRQIAPNMLIALCVLAKNQNGMYVNRVRVLESMPYPRHERIYLLVPQVPGVTIREQQQV